MKRYTINEILQGKLPKGSFVLVRWVDASDLKAILKEHINKPEVVSKDWGIYLGTSGRTKKMLLIGKDIVEVFNEWGASRIPVELVDEVIHILPREEMVKLVREIQVLDGKVNFRKYRLREARYRVTMA